MSDLLRSWDGIQREIVVLREHNLFYAGAHSHSLKHPYLNALLPGLVLIRAVCIFEDALREYLLGKKVSKTKVKKASLWQLIELSAKHKGISPDDCHIVRDARNDIAHQQKKISWGDLEQLLKNMEAFLCVDVPDGFSRDRREIKVTKRRLTPPEADPNTTIHTRTIGVLNSSGGEEEVIFSYDARV